MKRGGIFYGWYIVAAGLLLMTLNGGAVIYGFTAFIKPIAAAFGSRSGEKRTTEARAAWKKPSPN